MALGGVAAGIVAGRLVAPLAAAVVGAGRSRLRRDPFALLIDDHRKILSLLDEMAEAPAGSAVQRGRLFLMLKRKLTKHAMAEEDVVYPIVNNGAASEKERKHLYDEHAGMKILLYEIEEKLMAGEDWSGAVRQLRQLLRKHFDEEEQTIFPELRKQLSGAAVSKVSGQISREEAMVV
jgi:iron-sulfur cluster repair protein YtfE (RIC family)